MRIRAGFELTYECDVPTPMLLMLSPHPSRHADLVTDAGLSLTPDLPARSYLDGFGNVCTRMVAAAGRTTIASDFVVRDSGLPDTVAEDAEQHAVDDLPSDTLVYLLGSRYVETDALMELAWREFGATPATWARVQAICDFVNAHIAFDYQAAAPHRTAFGAYLDRTGVCRDFAHLAIALCRCMNIPARYCTGYLGDIGIPPQPYPMDFSAWFEAYIGGRWHTLDARHNTPRIGRILMATGRDAADVALSVSFGSARLVGFSVVTEEVEAVDADEPLALTA